MRRKSVLNQEDIDIVYKSLQKGFWKGFPWEFFSGEIHSPHAQCTSVLCSTLIQTAFVRTLIQLAYPISVGPPLQVLSWSFCFCCCPSSKEILFKAVRAIHRSILSIGE